jgi:coniferyl-aldehyde dehydrogenase
MLALLTFGLMSTLVTLPLLTLEQTMTPAANEAGKRPGQIPTNQHAQSAHYVPEHTKAGRQLDQILSRQRRAFLRDGPPSLNQRRANLKKLRSAILARRSEIEDVLNADFRPSLRHDCDHGNSFIQGIDYSTATCALHAAEAPHVALPMRFDARIEYQPLGVIGIMAPWNYPFSLALMPLATAIAAGNRAMIKPSELTPATSDLLARLLADIFPQEQVAVVTGDAAIGAVFSALPFDHLIFTGSTPVGRAVMRAASDNLVPVTLELGGKSPVIVAKGHALDHAAAGIAYGKLSNGGQTCIAPDYALVHEHEIEAFTAAYDKAVAALYPNGPASDDYTSIINDRHYARLNGLVDDARARGARILEVGRSPRCGRRPHWRRYRADAADDMPIMQKRLDRSACRVLSHVDSHRLRERAAPAGALLLRSRWRLARC